QGLVGKDAAAGKVQLILQSEGDGLPGGGALLRAVRGVDASDAGAAETSVHRVPDRDLAGGDAAGVAPVVGGVVADDELHREAELLGGHGGGTGVLEDRQHGFALVPRGVFGLGDDVIAHQRADRDDVHDRQLLFAEGATQLVDELVHLARGGLEGLLGVVHRVDLVHGDNDLRDVQQGGDGQVAAGLLDHAVTDVDEDDHQVRGGHAGDGVAGVLNVARGVRENEAAAVGGEVAVGHVDGDALLALGAQAVDQQRKVRVLQTAGGGDALHGLQLVGQDG